MRIKLKDSNEFKKVLLTNGFTQTDFAKVIEITPTYLSQILNEDRFPSAKIAKKIIDHLDLNFGDIFFIDDACKSYHDNSVGRMVDETRGDHSSAN